MRRLTPAGAGGIAVLAFAAEEWAELQGCLRSPRGGDVDLPPGGAVRLVQVLLAGVVVDQALLLSRPEGVELHVHGALALEEALAERFPPVAAAAAAAAPSPAEQLLRAALTVPQLELALEQLGHDFARELAVLAAMPAATRRVVAATAWQRTVTARALVEPHRVVLAGVQNAGKSTLLNALAGRERALTGATPGLTRDPVHELVGLDGYPYELVDTAGEGAVASTVDAEALARARAARAGATVVLVVDAARGPQPADLDLLATAALVVASKGDLPAADWPWARRPDLVVRCLSPDGPLAARRELGAALRRHRGLPVAGPVGGPAALDAAAAASLAALLS